MMYFSLLLFSFFFNWFLIILFIKKIKKNIYNSEGPPYSFNNNKLNTYSIIVLMSPILTFA